MSLKSNPGQINVIVNNASVAVGQVPLDGDQCSSDVLSATQPCGHVNDRQQYT